MSWRRVNVILNRLPPESEFKTAQRDGMDIDWENLPEMDGDGSWSKLENLVAGNYDQLAMLRWELRRMLGGKSPGDPEPEPLQRPGVKRRPKVVPLNAKGLAFLRYLQEHQGAHPPPDWDPAV